MFGYDNERVVFGLSMLNVGKEVQCRIVAAAIDELIGGSRGSYVDREIQFSQLAAKPLRGLHLPSSTPVLSFVVALSASLRRIFRKQHDGTISASPVRSSMRSLGIHQTIRSVSEEPAAFRRSPIPLRTLRVRARAGFPVQRLRNLLPCPALLVRIDESR